MANSTPNTTDTLAHSNGENLPDREHHDEHRAGLPLGELSDFQLIARCVDGDSAAWSELYLRCHEPLQTAIRAMYSKSMRDANLVDEISARVWYQLVRDDFCLLRRFDPQRGVRFTTYLSVIAKSQARQYFRAERRRCVRETIASRQIEAPPTIEQEISTLDFEDAFLEGLTVAELKFFHAALTTAERTQDAYSPENGWQLRHRILVKLHRFLIEHVQ